MSLPLPSMGPAPADHQRLTRRSIRELARIYLSASAYAGALDVLDRLKPQSWDEETILLRSEALIGLGRVPEAEQLLGPAMLPATIQPNRPSAQGGATPEHRSAPRRTGLPRRERQALWRFLLQLRILHRTGRYLHVLELGRTFFGSHRLTPSILLTRISTVIAQSMLALRQPAEARALYEEILDLYKELRSAEGIADALLGLANTQLLDCRWDEADALYQEARFRYEEMGQTDKALACLTNLGVLRGKRGDLAGGRLLLQQALTRCGQVGYQRRAATVLLGLGLIEIRSGEFSSARQRLLAVLRTVRSSGSQRYRGLAFEFLGEMFLYQGRLSRARRCLQGASRIAQGIAPEGDLAFEAKRLQAELALAERNVPRARTLAEEARALADAYGDTYEVAVCDRVLMELDAAEGDSEQAGRRLQTARGVFARLGETFQRARLELAALRLELREGNLPAGRIRDRLEEICRPFADLPDAPVTREARRVLAGVGWNVSALARALGVSRAALRRSLQLRDTVPPAHRVESR